MAKTLKEIILGRKFLINSFILVTAFILALLEKLTAEYATVAGIVGAAFNTADVLNTRRYTTSTSEGLD